MNSLQQPRAGSLQFDRASDELDGLLGAFFRAQVPEPWPALKLPATLSLREEGAAARRSSLFRSRFVLAASLLILLLSQLFISNMFSHRATDNNRGGLEATNRIDSARGKPAHSPILIPGHR